MSRAQLSIRVHRPPDWQDRRHQPRSDDSTVLSRINTAVSDLPTYGYRRVWALLRRESERDGLAVVNAKRVYRIMRAHHLLLERKPAEPRRKCAHKGRVAVAESNRRWSYKMNGKIPVLTDGHYSRANSLSSEVIIEYKFNLF